MTCVFRGHVTHMFFVFACVYLFHIVFKSHKLHLISFQTVKTEGPLALYKGIVPSYLRLGPWNIIVSFKLQ